MHDVVEAFRRFYCSTTGYDYAHVFVPEERSWLRQAAEGGRFRAPADPIDPVALLDRLTQVEVFERFLHRTFPGKTRFSIEGLDMLVPILDEVIGEAGEAGIRSILIGMAHRGRLNVMAHVLSKPYAADPRRVQGSGVVAQLPRGHGVDRRREVSRRRAPRDQGRPRDGSGRVDAAQPEPSRSVDPVVEGMARAAGTLTEKGGPPNVRSGAQRADPDSRRRGVPRQGIVAETLNLSRLAGLPHRRHDPHHRQQPARVHGRLARFLQHVVRERAGARLQDPDRPRERGRSGGLRRGGAARLRVPRDVPARLPDRPDRLSPPRAQRR